ncbi:hypothetical protein B0T17DRAFT_333584 [Bombardia bombarda]|uniref:Uncharacterized protein n=1 Tax=Bombardia bombarda TaxID=252184 RepID=A0AA40BYG3_9PEZI|nr:hypothetical protein B0T17DRAFT_333584 [Bombardia bombarda]
MAVLILVLNRLILGHSAREFFLFQPMSAVAIQPPATSLQHPATGQQPKSPCNQYLQPASSSSLLSIDQRLASRPVRDTIASLQRQAACSAQPCQSGMREPLPLGGELALVGCPLMTGTWTTDDTHTKFHVLSDGIVCLRFPKFFSGIPSPSRHWFQTSRLSEKGQKKINSQLHCPHVHRAIILGLGSSDELPRTCGTWISPREDGRRIVKSGPITPIRQSSNQ